MYLSGSVSWIATGRSYAAGDVERTCCLQMKLPNAE